MRANASSVRVITQFGIRLLRQLSLIGALTTVGSRPDLLSKAMALNFKNGISFLMLGLSLIGTMRAQGQPNEGNRPPQAGVGRPAPASAVLPDHILVQHRVGADVDSDHRSVQTRGASLAK